MTRADVLMAACALWLVTGLVFAGVHLWTILPPLFAYFLIALDGILRPASPWLHPVISHGDRHNPRVALTFDDGPDPEVTPQVLELLRRHGAHATFFVIGRHAETFPELVRRIAAEGHEIGNHSYAHPRLLNFAPPALLQREIERGRRALQNVTRGTADVSYRPPMGLKSPWLAYVQRRLHLRVVTWSLHARDTGRRPPELVAGRVLRRIRPGDIVLLHDGHDLPDRQRGTVVAALERILQGLGDKGLEAVTLGELLHDCARAGPVPAVKN